MFHHIEKEIGIHNETERIRRQIKLEQEIQKELRKEIATLKSQLDESKQGLLAASRLTSQFEFSQKQVTSLKDEGKF